MKRVVLSILLTAIFFFIVYNIFKGYAMKNDVEEHGIASVGKYISHDSWAKGETNTFEFYFEGKKIKGNGGRASKGFSKNIGKFYRISFSKEYPGVVIADFDEEVKDSFEILNAGFSRQDFN